jgi:hypothetical protein
MSIVVGIIILVLVLGLLEKIGLIGTGPSHRPPDSRLKSDTGWTAVGKAAPHTPLRSLPAKTRTEGDGLQPLARQNSFPIRKDASPIRDPIPSRELSIRDSAGDLYVRANTMRLTGELLAERHIYYLAYKTARIKLGNQHPIEGNDIAFCAILDAQEPDLQLHGLPTDPEHVSGLQYSRPDFDSAKPQNGAAFADLVNAEITKLKTSRDAFVAQINIAQGSKLYQTFIAAFIEIGGSGTSSSLKKKPDPLADWIHVNTDGPGHGFHFVGEKAGPVDKTDSPKIAENFTHDYQSMVKQSAAKRDIKHLVHFTNAVNLESIIKNGLCSIDILRQRGLDFHRNDQLRLDRYPRATSLSITHPNDKMFAKYRWQGAGEDWVVLVIDPQVLWSTNAAFSRHNAADARIRRLPLKDLRTFDSFDSMFLPLTNSLERKENHLLDCDPTDVQAEVLAFELIPPELIRSVVFSSEHSLRKFKSNLGGLPTCTHSEGKGFFGARSNARRTGWRFNG